ncbi:MAG: prolipoprotein diacylglyceryl transferase family protein, partial [Ignavibacterium sp.]
LMLIFGFRFFVEFLKENQSAFESALPINMGQILSIPFILLGLYFIFRKKQSVIAAKK